ncbi:MAG TPA: LysM domain-containing protein [Gemmatimonadaceae bacterium]
MKTTTFRSRIWCAFLAGALVAPAQLPAQGQPDSLRTHVVRPGDTFWGLALTYLGSGHRWREIFSLNTGRVTSADSLPVGVTLRVPHRDGAAPSETPNVRTPAAPPMEQPPPARADSQPPAVPPPSAPGETRRTIFFGARPGGGFAPVAADSSGTVPGAQSMTSTPAGVFELLSVPWVIDVGMLDVAGSCVGLGTGDAVVRGATAGGALLHTTMTISPPADAPAREGDRLVLVRPEATLPGLGRVVVPTGVVRLGDAATPRSAEIVAQYDVISCADHVVTASEAAGPPPDARPSRVPDGPTGRVVWVGGEALLPALRHAVIIDIGAAAGVRPGDVISIYAEDGTTEVAAASVVRVDGPTASALIVRRPQAGIVAGLSARVTEKVP